MSDEVSLTPAERAFFEALDDLGVRYLIVGLSAALLQGAPVVTQDIDLWFGLQAPWASINEAARRAGGFYTAGIGLQEPMLGGEGLERVDLVLTASGLPSFDAEYDRAEMCDVQGVRLRVLPLDRVIASKQAAGRAKDKMVMAALEATLRAREHRKA